MKNPAFTRKDCGEGKPDFGPLEFSIQTPRTVPNA